MRGMKDQLAGQPLAIHAGEGRRTALIQVALLLVITAPWWLAVGLPFIHIDDPFYVWQNGNLLPGAGGKGLAWAFTTTRGDFYFPVMWVSLLADVSMFGTGERMAAGMHATNVLLHVANTLLVYWVLTRMTGMPWRSWLVAALFGINPLRVESVAWVTERKDVLSAFFGLWGLLAYTQYARAAGARHWGWYGGVCALFALSLLSKPMLVTLPVLLLVLDWWPLERKVAWKLLVLEKVPLVAMSAAISVVTVMIQRQAGALVSEANLPLGARAGNAALSYFYYLRDTVYFQELSVFYPAYREMPWEMVGLAAVVLAGVTGGILWWWRRGGAEGKGALAGWLWFVGTLVPVIGLVQSGIQARADRFTYWPSIGLFMAVVFGLPGMWFEKRERRNLAIGLCMGALAFFAMGTTMRLLEWRDPVRMYQDDIARTGGHNQMLKSILATVAFNGGDLEEAEKWFRSSLDDMANMYDPNFGYGQLLAREGRWEEAKFHFELALRVRPNDAAAREQLARAEEKLREPGSAASGPAK